MLDFLFASAVGFFWWSSTGDVVDFFIVAGLIFLTTKLPADVLFLILAGALTLHFLANRKDSLPDV